MQTFAEAASMLLQPSSVGIIPTDTVYGLVARAADEQAVKRLYDLKLREGKPGTIIAANINQLEHLGIKARYLRAVAEYWPGAISIVIPCGTELLYLHEGVYSLAVRLPDNFDLQKLLEQTGPLLTSSANHPGKPTATTITEAKGYFGNTVDFYVDGGDLKGRQPSTIVRVVDDAIEVLRQGAVVIENNGVKQDDI